MEGEEEETDCGSNLYAPLCEYYDESYRVDQSLLARPEDVVKVSEDGNSGPVTILDIALKRREVLYMKDDLNLTIEKEEEFRKIIF